MSPFFAYYRFTPRIHFDVEDDARKGEVLAAKDRVETIKVMREKMVTY